MDNRQQACVCRWTFVAIQVNKKVVWQNARHINIPGCSRLLSQSQHDNPSLKLRVASTVLQKQKTGHADRPVLCFLRERNFIEAKTLLLCNIRPEQRRTENRVVLDDIGAAARTEARAIADACQHPRRGRQ